MEFTQQKSNQTFDLTDLSFLNVKTIRDSLKKFAVSGSSQAAKLAKEIEEKLATMDI